MGRHGLIRRLRSAFAVMDAAPGGARAMIHGKPKIQPVRSRIYIGSPVRKSEMRDMVRPGPVSYLDQAVFGAWERRWREGFVDGPCQCDCGCFKAGIALFELVGRPGDER